MNDMTMNDSQRKPSTIDGVCAIHFAGHDDEFWPATMVNRKSALATSHTPNHNSIRCIETHHDANCLDAIANDANFFQGNFGFFHAIINDAQYSCGFSVFLDANAYDAH